MSGTKLSSRVFQEGANPNRSGWAWHPPLPLQAVPVFVWPPRPHARSGSYSRARSSGRSCSRSRRLPRSLGSGSSPRSKDAWNSGPAGYSRGTHFVVRDPLLPGFVRRLPIAGEPVQEHLLVVPAHRGVEPPAGEPGERLLHS